MSFIEKMWSAEWMVFKWYLFLAPPISTVVTAECHFAEAIEPNNIKFFGLSI
jgi:hypothetical protein